MNKKEFALIAAALTAAYPNSKILSEKTSLEVWYRMLGDLNYDVVENAVTECIATHTFPPSIAEIRDLCIDRLTGPRLTVDEAWGTVKKAIRRYGYYRPEEAFASMDYTTLSIVKNLGWTNLCLSENDVADRANFRMAYEAKIARVDKERLLPESISEKKAQIQEHYIGKIKELTDNIKLLE